jgi:hypothetical protein
VAESLKDEVQHEVFETTRTIAQYRWSDEIEVLVAYLSTYEKNEVGQEVVKSLGWQDLERRSHAQAWLITNLNQPENRMDKLVLDALKGERKWAKRYREELYQVGAVATRVPLLSLELRGEIVGKALLS